ncbi:transcription factor kayak isoform X1 [Lasioglossum baleicum]|uniref:transcription factor kayak isoform X1 n=1 Tax=Lasioglossum baleicum TaxID=434251 RepID=UPI003FCD4A60
MKSSLIPANATFPRVPDLFPFPLLMIPHGGGSSSPSSRPSSRATRPQLDASPLEKGVVERCRRWPSRCARVSGTGRPCGDSALTEALSVSLRLPSSAGRSVGIAFFSLATRSFEWPSLSIGVRIIASDFSSWIRIIESCRVGILGRSARRRSTDKYDGDADADDAPQYRANLGADQRVSVAQPRGRVRAAVGRAVAADPGADPEHNGASHSHDECRPGGNQHHPRGVPSNAATAAGEAQHGRQKAHENDRDDPGGGGTPTDPPGEEQNGSSEVPQAKDGPHQCPARRD